MESNRFDPSLNILHRKHQQLDFLFEPKHVAVIGATEKENSVGRTLFWNLLRSPFGGTVFPVNPKRKSILGVKAYSSVSAVPEKIDLAVIVTPAKTVPGIIQECVDLNIPAAVIISAGFKEQGESGLLLEKEILEISRKGKMRIIGPNCLGVMNPFYGLNATFAPAMALKGNIAFLSQSGALCTAVLDWSLKEKIGFSMFVSMGSMVDVDWSDLIHYLSNDPNTHSILIYMESIGNPRAFLSAAREVALTKPIILIKSGITEESAKAAASHTGSLAGSDAALNAALKRVGVLRVDSISDLFSMAEILSKQTKPLGPHLAIITNAGGPGVIATDALIKNKGKLASLSPDTYEKLNVFLPQEWSHNNPVDILGDAAEDLYAKTLEVVAKDSNTDGILVILTPQYMTHPTETAEKIKTFAKIPQKPLLASWMGASTVKEGIQILTEAGIPTFEYPDLACKAFAYMWAYSDNLKELYETPLVSQEATYDEKKDFLKKRELEELFSEVRKEKRALLTEFEAKKVLDLFNIPTVPTKIAQTKKEAVSLAKEFGFPIVLKLFSKTLTHKTDVGGVKLNLNNEDAVSLAFDEIYTSVATKAGKEHFQGVTVQPMIRGDGYELILGSSVDKEFGPILLFGSGGLLVEVLKDSALALPPLTSTLARRLMSETKIYEALKKGVRGKKTIDFLELEKILVRFSNLIAEYPIIKECDINPLFVSSERIIALDARILLHDVGEKIPGLAIRPYPSHYVQSWALKNQTIVTIRPIRPEDEPAMGSFLKKLSEKSLLQRYLKVLHYDELATHERLIHMCFNDYDREIALISETEEKEILGIGRFSKIPGTNEATFALLIQDKWQHQGLGTKLLQNLIQIARNEKMDRLVAQMLPENKEMQKMCQNFGFILTLEDSLIFAELKL